MLQNQFDSYEKYSLLIKLFGVGVLVTQLHYSEVSFLLVVVLLVLWLQDAIWKTFQGRIEVRLLKIEKALAGDSAEQGTDIACQFNTEYQQQRPGSAGLIVEYCRQAVRPTVAFPHIVLVLLAGYWAIVS